MVSTQLRHAWNVLAVLDPSTRISLSVIEFTPVETKGGGTLEAPGLVAPSRFLDHLILSASIIRKSKIKSMIL